MAKTIIGVAGLAPFETSDNWRFACEEIIRCGHNPVITEVHRANGSVERQITTNLKTNGGVDFICNQIGNSALASASAVAKFMAISADAGAPSASDTTLTGEINTNGLGRQACTYGHTNGQTTFTQQSVWSSITGTQNGIQKMALFTAVSSGTMVFETALAVSKSVSSGDTLTVSWTGTVS
jgi:hypothetical protein